MLAAHDMPDDRPAGDHDADRYHLPVMADEVVRLLGCAPSPLDAPTTWVDGTVGGGGHSARILQETAPGGRLIGIDRDDAALAAAGTRLSAFGNRARLFRFRFDEIDQVLEVAGVPAGSVDGALLDIGVSSRQLDDASRGFSFAANGPLDMRMDRRDGKTAADLVNTLGHGELARIFSVYGEEQNAGRVAGVIVDRRAATPFETTRQLVDAVLAAFGGREKIGRTHVATRTFQALRIAVNGELEALEAALPRFLDVLKVGGRLAVISFHSLEDRIVKHVMRDWATGCICPKQIPICVCARTPRVRLIARKGAKATDAEVDRNPRARSATLRAIEKVAQA